MLSGARLAVEQSCAGAQSNAATLTQAPSAALQGQLPVTSRLRNWVVIILGVLCMVSGTYSSISSMVAAAA